MPHIARHVVLCLLPLAGFVGGCSPADLEPATPDASAPESFDYGVASDEPDAPAHSGTLRIVEGPTPIPQGNATGASDLTVLTDTFAFSLSVESAPPWGVAPGGILDIARIIDGELSKDQVSLVDFIPNNWSSWPTTYQDVAVVEATPDHVVLATRRDWGEMTVISQYEVRAGATGIALTTTLYNGGPAADDLYSGYVMWPDGGHLTGVPGVGGVDLVDASDRKADWSAAYDRDWMIGLLSEEFTHVHYGGRDHYRHHRLDEGAQATFVAWLEIGHGGSTAPMVRAQANRDRIAQPETTWRVVDDHGAPVAEPAVLVRQGDDVLFWEVGTDGSVTLPLLPDATVQAMSEGYGTSESRAAASASDGPLVLPSPAIVDLTLTLDGVPAHGRLDILDGYEPPIAYLGAARSFTRLSDPGRATLTLSPGDYRLGVSHGAPFITPMREIELSLGAGDTQSIPVALTSVVEHGRESWFAADLHHHSDILDGFTPPRDMFVSQLAAGLDLVFLSDHDTTVHHAEVQEMADAEGVPFIPSMEISPSWGHFNPYPLPLGAQLGVAPRTASLQEILDDVATMGAPTAQANHPDINYGYFTSLEAGTMPGEADSRLRLFEINSHVDYPATLERLRTMWTAGERVYMTAGSDTHNVWTEDSGRVRLFAHLPGEVTADRFVEAAQAGRTVVSFGPMIYPRDAVDFGDTIPAGTPLTVQARSALGLKTLEAWVDGEVAQSWSFSGETDGGGTFTVPEGATWMGWVAIDTNDHAAYTNPVWID